MIAVTGNLSLGVHREKIGDIEIGDLRPGEYRNITNAELQHLWTNTPLDQCSDDFVVKPDQQRRTKRNTHLKKRFKDTNVDVEDKKYKKSKK